MYKKIIYVIMPLLFFVTSCSDDESSNLDELQEQQEEEQVIEEEVEEEEQEEQEENSLTITEEILELVNEHRNSIDLPDLTRNVTADALVVEHTNYMISQGVISHDNFADRVDQMRMEENVSGAGENVASGFPTAETVVAGWLESEGHRDNIEGNYTHTGIAAILDDQGRYYYTQFFYR